jgi:hypothetical protein
MDWIEQWFGFAPDNGDGTLELLIIGAAAVAAVIGVLWRIPRNRAATLLFVERLHRGLGGNPRS